MSQQDEPSNWPDKHTIIFWILVAFFLTLARVTYPQTAEQKPADWNEPQATMQILTIAGNNANLPRGLSHIIAYYESRFNPLAQSRYVNGYRSRGLMQIYFKYQTAIVSRHSAMSPRHFIWSDPEHSAIVGCNYLSYLIDRFGGSIYLGVLAYNWGEGNVERMTSVDQIPEDCKKYAESVLKMLDRWEEGW